MSWLFGDIVQQAAQCCDSREKGNPQGNSTTTPVLCLRKTSQWHSELDSRQNTVLLLAWGGITQEFTGPEEARIFKTRHQRTGSYIKEDLQKFIWNFFKSLWLRTEQDYLRFTRAYKVESGTEILPVHPCWGMLELQATRVKRPWWYLMNNLGIQLRN